MALLSHRSTSAIHTKAENAAEIDLVTKLVSDVKGVERVNNKMTVGKSN